MNVIENDHQLKITRNWIRKFNKAKKELLKSGPPPNVHPLLHKMQLNAIRGQVRELQEQINIYMATKSYEDK